MMKKTTFRKPEIRIQKIEMDCLLTGGSITDINDGGGDDGPGYGGGGTGPAYAPKIKSVWDE